MSIYFVLCPLIRNFVASYVNDYLSWSDIRTRTKSPTRRFPWYQPPAVRW